MTAFKHESVGDFYSIQEDWESYVERVSLYLVANDIIDEGKKNCPLGELLLPYNAVSL